MTVEGEPVTKPISICGMAFQNSTPLPWRTTLDNVLRRSRSWRRMLAGCAGTGVSMKIAPGPS